MKYTLVKPDGTLAASREFDTTPKQLPANKGRWLPDTIPTFDPLTQVATVISPVPSDALTIPYLISQRPSADMLAEKLAELATYRYNKEISGTAAGAVTIKTDRESQAALTGAYTSLKNGLIASVDWKTTDGWVSLTLVQIEPIAHLVASHVQACFTRESQHFAAIQALVNDPVQMMNYDITTGW